MTPESPNSSGKTLCSAQHLSPWQIPEVLRRWQTRALLLKALKFRARSTTLKWFWKGDWKLNYPVEMMERSCLILGESSYHKSAGLLYKKYSLKRVTELDETELSGYFKIC